MVHWMEGEEYRIHLIKSLLYTVELLAILLWNWRLSYDKVWTMEFVRCFHWEHSHVTNAGNLHIIKRCTLILYVCIALFHKFTIWCIIFMAWSVHCYCMSCGTEGNLIINGYCYSERFYTFKNLLKKMKLRLYVFISK